MNRSLACCPVCTLYLREGITLQNHLDTHPKDQVIQALLKATGEKGNETSTNTQHFSSSGTFVRQQFPQQTAQFINPSTHLTADTIQQFVSSNLTSTVVPQYIQVPTIVTPNGSLSLLPTQNVHYVPSNIQYSPSTFNPLYNPYIPHPYPLPQQVQVSTSFTSQNYINPLPGQVSVIASASLYQQATKNFAQKQQCTIATNTSAGTSPEVTNNETEPVAEKVEDSNDQVIAVEPSVSENSTNVETNSKKSSTVITLLKSTPEDDSLKNEEEFEVSDVLNGSVALPRPPSLTPAPNIQYRCSPAQSLEDKSLEATKVTSPRAFQPYLPPELPVTENRHVEESCVNEEFPVDCGAGIDATNDTEVCKLEDPECQKNCFKDINLLDYDDEVKSSLDQPNCEPGFYFEEEAAVLEEQCNKYDDFGGNEEENEATYTNLEPVTYTDLQPATRTRVLKNESNGSNYMEINGVRIYFSNEEYERMRWDNFPPSVDDQGNHSDARHHDSNTVIQLVNQKDNQAVEEIKSDVMNDDQFESSPSSLNIQADETMPAKGELSEQESLGADNSNWALTFHGEASYDRKPKDTITDTSDVTVVSEAKNKGAFKCSLCSESFTCPKERRVHKNSVHANCKRSRSLQKDSEVKTKPFKCSVCGEVFSSPKLRRQHMIQNKHFPLSKQTYKKVLEKEVVTVNKTQSVEFRVTSVKNETLLIKSEQLDLLRSCSRCGDVLPSLKKLKEHLRSVHSELRFQCSTCSQYFSAENEYNAHLKIHPFSCNQCDKVFYKKRNLNVHMKRHLKVKPYECRLCPKTFITRQKMEEHVNGHMGKKPLKCSLCSQCFTRHSNLIQHRNVHHFKIKRKVKDFVCRCGEIFHSRRKLEWHREVHDTKPKTCSFCTQKFIHNASLTRHIRRAHIPEYLPGEDRNVENISCPICKKIYIRSSLLVHMRVHSGSKPFCCKICSKKFATKWNLELHSWTHQSRNNMPYKCPNCKSAFFRESEFNSHINSHKNYKPFSCNICGQRFIRKYNCLRHQQEHRKAKEYVCTVAECGKTFHRSYYLKDHLKVHTGVRPYCCHICGKASSTKSNHNKHVRIHDTREPVNTEN